LSPVICIAVNVDPSFTGKYTVCGVLGYADQKFLPYENFWMYAGGETTEWRQLHNEGVQVYFAYF
jgi:hypothetical protein